MAKVIGIDLGTTNSCVAVMEGKTPGLENAEGHAHHALDRSLHGRRRAAGRPAGETPGGHHPEKTIPRQAAYWSPLR